MIIKCRVRGREFDKARQRNQHEKDAHSYVRGVGATRSNAVLTAEERAWINGENDGEPLIYAAAPMPKGDE